ncbi:MAG: ABC transporter ATP-binding protein [Desulfurococcales archaeon]|nr:ABC transporter ATP-binding protein [Desulfurococcales archaeon]
MPAPAILVEDLYKSYDEVRALNGVSFQVGEGEIYGLIGPNGAGKTTTLRIIAGLLRPDEGRVLVLGHDPFKEPVRVKKAISYLPEEAGVYKNLTGEYFLRFIAEIYSDSPREAEEMVERGAELSGLGERLRSPMKTYSKGMKRRLLLAATLMTNPRVAVLDEPTSGLDVYNSVLMRNAIREYARNSNATILLSSHNMLEVEYLCDRVAFIDHGVIIAEGTPGELLERYGAVNLEEAFVKAVGGGITYAGSKA